MNTVLDQDDAIYRLLNVANITSVISGGVYKGKRPNDSQLEDIVIKSLTLGDGTRQFGVANVNIHIQDIQSTVKGVPTTLANSARFKIIVNLVKAILEETDGETFALWIEDSSLNEVPELSQHFFNFRIEVRMYNHY